MKKEHPVCGAITHKKTPARPAFQSDGNFLCRSSPLENYRQKHRQNFLLPQARFGSSGDIPQEINNLEKEGGSIDNAPSIVNELSHNHLFLLRYFPPEPFTVSYTPHSHSIVPGGLLVTS